jgi:hypothetical protein
MKGRPASPGQEMTMAKDYEGLPAAATLQQSIILAQLEILRRLNRATHAGIARTSATGPAAVTEVIAIWSPAEE